jgi:ABC-2 type transport system permease protein
VTPRLFLHVVGLEARKSMSYRVDFWVNAVVGFVAELLLAWFLWRAVFAESGRSVVGGYTLDGIVLYSVVVILLAKLVRGPAFDMGISQDVYDGGLSRYLVYPAPYLAFKYAQHVGSLLPALVQTAFFGGWFLLVQGLPADERVTPATVAMGLVSTAVANLLHFLLAWPLQAVAFWADNVWSLMVMLRFVTGLLGGGMVPLSLFPDWARAANELLPFRFLFAVPADALLGRVPPGEWAAGLAIALAWCGVLVVLGRAVWRRGDLRYTGVGI